MQIPIDWQKHWVIHKKRCKSEKCYIFILSYFLSPFFASLLVLCCFFSASLLFFCCFFVASVLFFCCFFAAFILLLCFFFTISLLLTSAILSGSIIASETICYFLLLIISKMSFSKALCILLVYIPAK